MGNDSWAVSRAAFTLYPSTSEHMFDMSDHISVLAIGRKTGSFKLEANQLNRHKTSTIAIIWLCHYSHTLEPCIRNSDSKLLVQKDIQNRHKLVLNSQMLRISEHKFGFHAIDTNQNNGQLFSGYTTVRVFDGNAPQIYIKSVYVKVDDRCFGLLFNHIDSNEISVPPNTHLVFSAVVKNIDKIDSIEWQLSESTFELSWNNKVIDKNTTVSQLHLYSGSFHSLTFNLE